MSEINELKHLNTLLQGENSTLKSSLDDANVTNTRFQNKIIELEDKIVKLEAKPTNTITSSEFCI